MLTFFIALQLEPLILDCYLFFFPGHPFCYYCVECETAICSLCSDLSHWRHSIVRMSEAADKEKEHMDLLVNGAKAQVSTEASGDSV